MVAGSFCSIGPRVIMGSGSHPVGYVSTHPIFYSDKPPVSLRFCETSELNEQEPIRLGNDVWIGARTYVKNGINIGSGSIIGAGAVVVKDVQPYAVVGGVPAKLIKWRFSENIREELLKSCWWDLPIDRIKELRSVIASQDTIRFLDEVRKIKKVQQ